MNVIAAACENEWTWQGVALVSVLAVCATVAYAVHRYTATRYAEGEDEQPSRPDPTEPTT